MSKYKKKYTFIEFVGATEADDFDNITNEDIQWGKDLISSLLNAKYHEGDCTKQPFTCSLCLLEGLLNEYREYYFNEEKYREKYVNN